MAQDPGGKVSGEVLFEFTQLGGQMRVAAIHAASATEVVIIAPLTASRLQMQNIALAKLQRKLDQSAHAPDAPPDDPKPKPTRVEKTV
jgi:hypothetical protein